MLFVHVVTDDYSCNVHSCDIGNIMQQWICSAVTAMHVEHATAWCDSPVHYWHVMHYVKVIKYYNYMLILLWLHVSTTWLWRLLVQYYLAGLSISWIRSIRTIGKTAIALNLNINSSRPIAVSTGFSVPHEEVATAIGFRLIKETYILAFHYASYM